VENVYIEQRILKSGTSVSWDIAHHMYVRQPLDGMIIIVSEKPGNMLAPIRKQWMKVRRRLERERAGTLDASMAHDLEIKLRLMNEMTFNTVDDLSSENCVLFIKPYQLNKVTAKCHTAYLLCPLSTIERRLLLVNMQPHGLLVTYV